MLREKLKWLWCLVRCLMGSPQASQYHSIRSVGGSALNGLPPSKPAIGLTVNVAKQVDVMMVVVCCGMLKWWITEH